MSDLGRELLGSVASAAASALSNTSSNLPASSTKQEAPVFDNANSQSDGKSTLKRMEFEFQGKSYVFLFNPEEYTQTEPNRVTITQSKAGAWVDDFGGGIPSVTMKGTTGFKGRGADPTTGFEAFKELRDFIREYYYKLAPGTEVTDASEMTWHNYTDGEHWIVVPKTFSLMRSVARPLLYMYDIQLTLLRPASTPSSVNTALVATLAKVATTSNE